MKHRFFFLQFFCLFLWITTPVLAQTMEQPTDDEPFITSTAPAASASAATTGEGGTVSQAPSNCFIYGIIFLGLLISIVSMLLIRSALANSSWSLADALSEEAEISDQGEDDESQPVLIKKLVPSSSRMVALMGTIAILFMFLSFGAFALFHFAKTGKMPEGIDKVVKFLTAGLTLFAPYVVNKFSKSFEALSPKH